MNDLASLRIYFRSKTRLRRNGFWADFFAPSLGMYLISSAKKFGIEQAVHQPIIAGYLQGDPIAFDLSEVPPPKLPSCVELIDHEAKLREFLKNHEKELLEVRIILARSEDILFKRYK